MMKRVFQGLAMGGLLALGGAAQAALVNAGNGLVNDTVLDITWVADASLSSAQSWIDLVQWAEDLVYAGYDDWRLASLSTSAATDSVFACSGGTEQDCIDSGNELGYMFHYNIPGAFPKTGNQTVGDVTLTGIQFAHWSGTELASTPTWAWYFIPAAGVQTGGQKGDQLYGWAVRDGQVGSVPLPGTAVLMALGLAGLGARRLARRATPVVRSAG